MAQARRRLDRLAAEVRWDFLYFLRVSVQNVEEGKQGGRNRTGVNGNAKTKT